MTAIFPGVYENGRCRYQLPIAFHNCHTIFVAIELDLKVV